MRAAQEAQGFRRTGCAVGASSASGYGHSRSDGTAFQGKGDSRNAAITNASTRKQSPPRRHSPSPPRRRSPSPPRRRSPSPEREHHHKSSSSQ